MQNESSRSSSADSPASGTQVPTVPMVPLVIGVTGHRDLREEDRDALTSEVRRYLEDLRTQCPSTPLVLLSPLAEGADRLVARVALQVGASLVVPLPMPREMYVADFATDAALADFDELTESAAQVFDLPFADSNTASNVGPPGPHRDKQYAALGAFVARNSQILLALWDGRDDDEHLKLGGAADVVTYRLGRNRAPLAQAGAASGAVGAGPVAHIVTPRASQAVVPEDAFARRMLYPTGMEQEAHDRALARLDGFNGDALTMAGALASDRLASRRSLLGGAASRSAADEGKVRSTVPESFEALSECFAVADTLAGRFAKRSASALKYLFACVLAAALAFNLYHSQPHHPPAGSPKWISAWFEMPLFLVAFLTISVVCSTVVYRWVSRADYMNKHLDYRALAEALRVQLYWYLAALTEPVSDHYLDKQRGELAWIHNAARSLWLVTSDAGRSISEPALQERAANLQLIRERWVDDQARYYSSQARRELVLQERDERLASLLLGLSLGLSVLLAVALILPKLSHAHALHTLHEWVEGDWVHGLIMVAIVMSAIGAGLVHTYSQHRARSEHARRYAEMSTMFTDAGLRLGELCQAERYDDAQDLVRDLGEAALAENGDWVLLHRERPLEVPHAV